LRQQVVLFFPQHRRSSVDRSGHRRNSARSDQRSAIWNSVPVASG
jgi:hypothetical protein